MATYYKGAGPGSHWSATDPRTVGGFSVLPHRPPGSGAVVAHITSGSFPSPYLSFSASFGIARGYALRGPAGRASPRMPGYVYEIDPSLAPAGSLTFVEPVQAISAAFPSSGATCPHHHNGGADLIHAVADPRHPRYEKALATAPFARPGAMPVPPIIRPELQALVWALRDAELLVLHHLPSACIVGRHPVTR